LISQVVLWGISMANEPGDSPAGASRHAAEERDNSRRVMELPILPRLPGELRLSHLGTTSVVHHKIHSRLAAQGQSRRLDDVRSLSAMPLTTAVVADISISS
jgi:hypothetical protein